MKNSIRSAVAVLLFASTLMLTLVLSAQAPKLSFDVISIKPDNDPKVNPAGGLPRQANGGLFHVTKRPVMDLLFISPKAKSALRCGRRAPTRDFFCRLSATAERLSTAS